MKREYQGWRKKKVKEESDAWKLGTWGVQQTLTFIMILLRVSPDLFRKRTFDSADGHFGSSISEDTLVNCCFDPNARLIRISHLESYYS